jgi:zinc protease
LETLTLPNSSPLVSFRILFNTGAAQDPAGKWGVASLTAAMIAEAGSRALSYEEIVRAMYPMAAAFHHQVDKEMTVFFGSTHLDNLERYYRIISEMVLDPGWREEDFTRLKEDAINFLKVNLRQNNDEELGKEELYNFIYSGHPYGHHSVGAVESLERLTIEDVKQFYRQNYTAANLVIGLAGGFTEGFASRVGRDFSARLATETAPGLVLRLPDEINGHSMRVIKKEARGTAISFGHPISVTRSHPDWPALFVAQSYFGQHRSSNSLLYQRLRQVRGLNYGDYAYIEYFPRGMFQFHPDPNLCRSQQIFQVWIRPVEPQNGLFALRAALYELGKLTRRGMTREDFEATRRFLSKFVNLLTKTQDARLGYALDSRYYGTPEFTRYVRDRLESLTVEEVNHAIKTHLRADRLKIVVVTEDAETFLKSALESQPSPITYETPMPADVLEEDKIIETYKLDLNPQLAEVVPVEQSFQD